MCVNITPRAAKYMRQIVRFGEGSASAGFRLSVKPGGCSGFDSSFTVAETPTPGDTVIEQNGALLFLTAESCSLLHGYTIDFKESPSSSGLSFTNPNGPHVCGCGAGDGAAAGGVGVVTFMKRDQAPQGAMAGCSSHKG